MALQSFHFFLIGGCRYVAIFSTKLLTQRCSWMKGIWMCWFAYTRHSPTPVARIPVIISWQSIKFNISNILALNLPFKKNKPKQKKIVLSRSFIYCLSFQIVSQFLWYKCFPFVIVFDAIRNNSTAVLGEF